MKFNFTLCLFLALSYNLQAQLTRNEAISLVVEELIHPDSLNYYHLYSKYEMMHSGDTLWQEDYFGFQIVPYEDSWVFFIDDVPVAFWAHPCRYVFVDVTSGEYQVIEDSWPPQHYFSTSFSDDWEWILEMVSVHNIRNYSSIKVFPNPVADHLAIVTSAYNGSPLKCIIFDASGRTIRSFQSNYPTRMSLDIHNLNPGLYTLWIIRNAEVIGLRKIVKIEGM